MLHSSRLAERILCLCWIGFLPSLAGSQERHFPDKTSTSCKEVHARYAIYVQRDSLWIPGSKHLIIVTDKKLDNILQNAGWQDHVLFGDFTICSTTLDDPLKLTGKNDVTIKSYRNIQVLQR